MQRLFGHRKETMHQSSNMGQGSASLNDDQLLANDTSSSDSSDVELLNDGLDGSVQLISSSSNNSNNNSNNNNNNNRGSISHLSRQHHRISRAKRSKRAMRSGANTVANLRSKRYQMLKTEGNIQSRVHPTIKARQNQMYLITTLLPAQTDQPLINRILPKELILRIFSFLDITSLCRCAQTCRHWNLLALDGSNWQQVDLFQFQKDIKTVVDGTKFFQFWWAHWRMNGGEMSPKYCLLYFSSKSSVPTVFIVVASAVVVIVVVVVVYGYCCCCKAITIITLILFLLLLLQFIVLVIVVVVSLLFNCMLIQSRLLLRCMQKEIWKRRVVVISNYFSFMT